MSSSSSRPSSRASNGTISRQRSLPGLKDTPSQACTSPQTTATTTRAASRPRPPSPSSCRSTPSPDLTSRNKCPGCLQRRPHHHHSHNHNNIAVDGRTSPSGGAAVVTTSSAFGSGRIRPSVRRLFDEPPPSPSSPKSNTSSSSSPSPRREASRAGSRSPSIARSVSSLSNNGDSPKSGGTEQRPRWVGAWSSTYTPPPSKSYTRRESIPPASHNNLLAARNSSNSGLDEPPPLLSAYASAAGLRQPPRRRETYDPSIARNRNNNNQHARGRSTSAVVCLASAAKGASAALREKSPCDTADSNRRASVCYPIGEDDDCNHDHHGMEGVHSRDGEDGHVAGPTSSLEGSPNTTLLTEGRSTPSQSTTAAASTVGKAWKFALMPSPPLETSPALIRKFLSTEALKGSSSSNSSTSPSIPSSSPPASGSSSSSSYAGLFVTAPAVAAVSSVQFLAKSRVVVAEAASFIGQQPMSSSASALSVSTTSPSTVDEREFLAASLLSYETTTTLLEQDGGDDNCNASNLLTRWQQRSPSPLGQYSIAAGSSTDLSDNDNRSVTPTPSISGRANSLRTKASIDALSAMDRPGTPSSCSSPAQELFSRIMDQNNDHINNNRRHSMGSLVDIMASKARMYLSPSSRNSIDGSSPVASPENNNNGSVRRVASISSSSSLGYSALSNDAGRPHRNSISDIVSPASSTLPPLPPSHHQTNPQTRPHHPHQQVVRVSSIESFPRHPSSSSSNLRIQSLRDLFRSSSSSSSSSSAVSVTGAAGAGAGGSNSNSLTSTPNHSRTPTVESGPLDNNSNAGGASRRNSLMDLLTPFTSSKPHPPSTQDDDHRSTTSSSSSSTITRHRSETHGSGTSSTTSSSPCPSPVLKKLSSRSSLSLVAPPLVVPHIKQSPKLSHATLLSLTSTSVADTNDSSSTDGSFSQPNNTNNNGTLRRPKYQVLTTPASNAGNNRPSPLPSFTAVNEIWMDPTTSTLHQLPGVLLTPSLPFPLSSNATSTATQLPSTTLSNGGGPTGQGESVEWPWTNMNPTDRDKWPTAFHISAQHGGLLALPPTYSPGSELDEASALSLSRTHSQGLPLDYGSYVMEARRHFGTAGGESVPSSLAESRVSASGGSLYYDETLGQTPYGNGYYYGGYPQQHHQEQYDQYGPLGPPAATGY